VYPVSLSALPVSLLLCSDFVISCRLGSPLLAFKNLCVCLGVQRKLRKVGWQQLHVHTVNARVQDQPMYVFAYFIKLYTKSRVVCNKTASVIKTAVECFKSFDIFIFISMKTNVCS